MGLRSGDQERASVEGSLIPLLSRTLGSWIGSGPCGCILLVVKLMDQYLTCLTLQMVV